MAQVHLADRGMILYRLVGKTHNDICKGHQIHEVKRSPGESTDDLIDRWHSEGEEWLRQADSPFSMFMLKDGWDGSAAGFKEWRVAVFKRDGKAVNIYMPVRNKKFVFEDVGFHSSEGIFLSCSDSVAADVGRALGLQVTVCHSSRLPSAV
jgi:hypothetical protein